MFYKVDSVRLSMREYIWSTPILLLPILILLKLLRIRISVPGAVPDSLEPFRIDPADIPEDVKAKIEPLEEQMRGCGFIDPAYHWICDPFGSRKVCMATFRHVSGSTLGQIGFCRISLQKTPKESVYPAFITCYRDGTYFISSARRQEMLSSPAHQVQRLVGASVADLWNAHCQEASLKSFGKTVITVHTPQAMLELAKKEEADGIEFQVARGVLVPHDEAQQQTIETVMTAPGPEIDRTFAAVYEEINRLINRKAGWVSMILVLILSMILFFSMGMKEQGWKSLALISGILFFHEFGHLAAMWLFHYRNLRMFFLPFMGAAVTGQNYNVPGWKKAIVSLMGPLPGIIVGGVLGILAMKYDWQMAYWAAYMLLAINLFNLLPVMPLDGGQLMHAVLFSRHPIIDAFFRAVAAVLLILSGFAGMRGLVAFGIFMLIALPMTYRIGKVVHRLRKSGFDADSPDARTIPLETAQLIYNEIHPVLPANANVKTTAQWTLNAFELLNAKPPGFFASLALIGAHGFAFLTAAVILVAMVIAQHGGFQNLFWARFMSQPKHPVESEKVLHWEGLDAKPAARPAVNTIIADFPSPKDAEKNYRQISAKLPATATVTLFGQTVMLTLPAEEDDAREKWLNELDSCSKKVLVHSKKFPTHFSFTCNATDAKSAEAIAESINTYLEVTAAMQLIPPWSPEHKLTPRELKARRTYKAIQDNSETYDDPRLTSFYEKIMTARQRGDEKAVEKLNRENHQLRLDIQKEHLNKLRGEGKDKWDLELIDLYEKSPPPNRDDFMDMEDVTAEKVDENAKKNKPWELDFGSHLGQLPLDGENPAPGANRFSAQFGSAHAIDRAIYVNLTFERPSIGAPAFIKWLAKRGCTKMKYDVQSIAEMDED